MLAILLLYISKVLCQEIPTPATLLGPQHYNYHAYRISDVDPTKKGPVLFPNDAPPPPRPPLVVTSRPLSESIARSELNPLPQNDTTQSNTQSSGNQAFDVDIDPKLLSNNPYQNFVDVDSGLNPETQASTYNAFPSAHLLRNHYDYEPNNRYDFEQSYTLPPIYKSISGQARRNVVKLKKPIQYNLQDDYGHYDDKQNSDENNQYAFSYRVNDHKTGDDFSHSQQSSGSATKGEYRVRLPDGRMQIVSYTADENGYKADVRYEDGGSHNQQNLKNQKDNAVHYQNANIQSKNLYNIINEKEFDIKNYYQNDNSNYNANHYYKPKEINLDKDYLNDYDYSSEYQNYEANSPYQSKFSIYNPTYTTIKPITENEISDSVIYESSTKAVVVENSNNLYNTKPLQSLVSHSQSLPTPTSLVNSHSLSTPISSVIPPSVSYSTSPVIPQSISPTSLSPSSYLASTIASLRDRIAAKPVLSKSFIDRINKYITFK